MASEYSLIRKWNLKASFSSALDHFIESCAISTFKIINNIITKLKKKILTLFKCQTYVLRYSTFYCSPGKEKKNGTNSVAWISEGSYRFSFKFIIPDKYLPTSFEGRHGNIRYWARAVIERRLGKSDIKTKPAQFLIGDYVALEDFDHVSVSKISVLCCIIEIVPSSSSIICLALHHCN